MLHLLLCGLHFFIRPPLKGRLSFSILTFSVIPGTQVSHSTHTFNSSEIANFLYKTTEMWPIPSSASRFIRLTSAARHVGLTHCFIYAHLWVQKGTLLWALSAFSQPQLRMSPSIKDSALVENGVPGPYFSSWICFYFSLLLRQQPRLSSNVRCFPSASMGLGCHVNTPAPAAPDVPQI